MTATYTGDGSHTGSSGSATIAVIYKFVGFLSPMDNPPIVNTGRAGKTFPVKFQLQDANGTFISTLSSVNSVTQKAVDCASLVGPSDPVDATTNAAGLHFDLVNNTFVFNWKSPATAGCYELFVNLDDTKMHQANFQLS